MDRLLKEYLETAYDSPLEVKAYDMESHIMIGIYCKNMCIAKGQINEGEGFSYVSWSIPIQAWNKMCSYVPTIQVEMYKEIISWIRDKCKTQGISMIEIKGLDA